MPCSLNAGTSSGVTAEGVASVDVVAPIGVAVAGRCNETAGLELATAGVPVTGVVFAAFAGVNVLDSAGGRFRAAIFCRRCNTRKSPSAATRTNIKSVASRVPHVAAGGSAGRNRRPPGGGLFCCAAFARFKASLIWLMRGYLLPARESPSQPSDNLSSAVDGRSPRAKPYRKGHSPAAVCPCCICKCATTPGA